MSIDSLLVFHTVKISMTAEKVLRAAGVRFEVRPLPKEIVAGCSIAIGVSSADLVAAREALDKANIPVEAIYSHVGEEWEIRPHPEGSPAPGTCRIYLDNNATTRPYAEVIRAVTAHLSETFGNPSSVHSEGRRAREVVEEAREAVSRLIAREAPRDTSEIIFTSGGTEANNMALLGVASSQRNRGDHIITSKTEHPSVLEACCRLETIGMRVSYVPVDSEGTVDLAALTRAIEPRTILISVAWANNETGVIQQVREIARIATKSGILFHTDAVQAAGKIPLDVKAEGADLLSLSAHKFHGVKGAGALYVRSGIKLGPILHGGGQESGLRPGTENVAAIVGMGIAARIALEELPRTSRQLRKLRDILYEDLKEKIPRVKINGHPSRRLPNTVNLCFHDISGEEIAGFLDKEGICVSTGSACSSAEPEPSHVLLAMGLTEEEARSSVRFSLGRDTTAEDIQRTVQAVTRIVQRYR